MAVVNKPANKARINDEGTVPISSHRKYVVVSGYYGFDNLGDEAILEELTNELKKLIKPENIIVFIRQSKTHWPNSLVSVLWNEQTCLPFPTCANPAACS